MDINIFELADVAAILGIEKSRIKNWTIGRPFSVRPSARVSFGTGSRNWFSRDDLYLFALVQRFNEAGVPVDGIRAMLKAVEPVKGKVDALLRDGKNVVVIDYKTPSSSYEARVEAEASRRLEPDIVAYETNLKSIRDGISEKIANYAATPHRKMATPRNRKGRRSRKKNL